MLKAWRELRRLGIMGMNQRNLEFIAPNNSRRFYPLVDDKLKCKEIAKAAGIQVPELYCVVEIEQQVAHLGEMLEPHGDFVVKPVNGSGGNGILVITGRRGPRYLRASGVAMQLPELQHHVSNILSGLYSLGGQPDRTLVEYRVKIDPLFESLSFAGVPDVRIIVYLGVPVMAMLRLPTRQSDGKANLHQGAVGVGIDIGSGVTTGGIHHNRPVAEHPDTFTPLAGVQIPDWPRLLHLAASCYEISHLGYLGVDFVFDRTHGPMMLEMNARPGLSIQIANRVGLDPRLHQVSAQAELGNAEQRVAFALANFKADPQATPVEDYEVNVAWMQRSGIRDD